MSQNIQLLVGGVDRTANMDQTSAPYSISKNFSRQGDTATFTLVDDHKTVNAYSFYPAIDTTVQLTDVGLGKVLFAGICNKPQFYWDGPNLAHWALNCVDYSTLADNAAVVGDVVNITAGQAMVNLVNQANCGIKAALVANGGFVTPGPTISFLRVNYEQLSQALKEIARAASQQGNTSYGWRVDENLNLRFQSKLQDIASGVTMTNDVSLVNSVSNTLGFFDGSSYSYVWDATQIHNNIIVIGSQIKAIRTDTWTADGSQTQYLLSFPLDTTVNSASLKIGGVVTTVTVVTANQAAPTSGWYVIAAQNGQWSLQNPATLSRGTTVAVTYHYSAPVIASVADYTSQGVLSNLPNGGKFSVVDTNSTIQTLQAAQAEGSAQLTEFAYALQTVQFTTSPKWGGHIEIGSTFVLNDVLTPDIQAAGAVGISGNFIVTAASINGLTNNFRTYTISAVRL